MSKEKQHIDDFLRSSLESHKVKPSHSFWKGIHARTGLFGNALLWKLGIPVLLLIGGLTAFYLNDSENSYRNSQTEVAAAEEAPEASGTRETLPDELAKTPPSEKPSASDALGSNFSSETESVSEKYGASVPSKLTNPVREEKSNKLSSQAETHLNNSVSDLPSLSAIKLSGKMKTPEVFLFQNSRKGNGNDDMKKPETRLYLSTGFNFTSLSSDTITELRNHEFGLEASVKISPALHLQTGLLYNRITDRGFGKWEYTTYENVGTLNILLSIGGETMADDTTMFVLQQVPLYDSINHTITGRIKSKASYFKIPIKLRYNTLKLPRMDIEIVGGVTAHLLDEQTYIYEKLEDKYFSPLLPERERIYLSSSAGLAFTYYFRKKTGIWMHPEVNIPIDSPFKWDDKLQDYQFTLKAGIVIKL